MNEAQKSRFAGTEEVCVDASDLTDVAVDKHMHTQAPLWYGTVTAVKPLGYMQVCFNK